MLTICIEQQDMQRSSKAYLQADYLTVRSTSIMKFAVYTWDKQNLCAYMCECYATQDSACRHGSYQQNPYNAIYCGVDLSSL